MLRIVTEIGAGGGNFCGGHVKSFFERMHQLEQRVARLEQESNQLGQQAAASVNAKSVGREVAQRMGL